MICVSPSKLHVDETEYVPNNHATDITVSDTYVHDRLWWIRGRCGYGRYVIIHMHMPGAGSCNVCCLKAWREWISIICVCLITAACDMKTLKQNWEAMHKHHSTSTGRDAACPRHQLHAYHFLLPLSFTFSFFCLLRLQHSPAWDSTTNVDLRTW